MVAKKKSSKKLKVSRPEVFSPKRLADSAGMDSMFDDMRRMQERMDHMFNSVWSTDPITGARLSLPLNLPTREGVEKDAWVRPLSDFYETKSHICADVDLPGIEKKDISLNVSNDRIEIRAEKKHEKKEEKKGAFRMERSYSGFFRSFVLPSHVDASKINASFKDGVLKLRVPKSSKSSHPSKSIRIN